MAFWDRWLHPKTDGQVEATDTGKIVLPRDLVNALNAVSGGRARITVVSSDICPASAAIIYAEQQRLKNLQPGDLMRDGTIYLGKYAPIDREGKSLSKTFNVLVAPEDLPHTMKYVEAVNYIATLKKWHGYDGTNYATDREIYAALKDGSYNGGWIIPTRELLVGTEPNGLSGIRNSKIIQPDNLFDHQNKGAFKDLFSMLADASYWSSTEMLGMPSVAWNTNFSDGHEGWNGKNSLQFRCRPVRLVEVPDS